MFGITCVPSSVYTFLFRFKHHFTCPQARHFLLCCWIVTGLLLDSGTGRVSSVVRFLPERIRYWALLRLLRSGQWDADAVIHDAATATLADLPPPAQGVCYLVVDPTLKRKRGLKHPLSRKRRLNRFKPFVYGFEVVLVIASVGPYRVPIFEAVVDPAIPGHANALVRQAIAEFVVPRWAKQVVVIGDAGLSANATIRAIEARGFDWVFAMPRSRKFADRRSVRDLVTYLPKSCYRRRASHTPDGRRRDYWTYRKQAELRGLGNVTIVLSKKRRNEGPKAIKIIVTNIEKLSTAAICTVYARRWGVETTIKELKSGLHLGRMQVTKEPERVKRSVAVSVLAYITLVWIYGRTKTPVRRFSLFDLKRRFLEDVLEEQRKRTESRWRRRIDKLKRAA
jgi:hypothetical protein